MNKEDLNRLEGQRNIMGACSMIFITFFGIFGILLFSESTNSPGIYLILGIVSAGIGMFLGMKCSEIEQEIKKIKG